MIGVCALWRDVERRWVQGWYFVWYLTEFAAKRRESISNSLQIARSIVQIETR